MRQPLYAVIEIECICCGMGDVTHILAGVFEHRGGALQFQQHLSEYRAKLGLVFPHSQIIVMEIPETNGITQNAVYESTMNAINKEIAKKERKRKKFSEGE